MKRKFLVVVLFYFTAIAYSQKDTAVISSPGSPNNLSESIKIPNNVSLDTLTFDELITYRKQAVTLRNTGMVLTLGGIGLTAAGIIAGAIIMEKPVTDSGRDSKEQFGKGIGIIALTGLFGIPSTFIGIPSWAVGGMRKIKAELILQKFYIPQGNSGAYGLGIRIRF